MNKTDISLLDRPERLAIASAVLPLLDGPTGAFDLLAKHASQIAEAPVALISIIDDHCQRFIGLHGADLDFTTREAALCSRVVVGTSDVIISDALQDESLADNPLVHGSFGLRSYAGTPLFVDGQKIGAVCVVDHTPRDFDERCLRLLRSLADAASALVELQLASPKPPEFPSVIPSGLHEQVLNVIEQAVIVTDLENRVTWANGSTSELFDNGSPVGRLVDDIVSAPTHHHDNRARHITERIAPLIDPSSGEITGTVRNYADVTDGETERLRLERLVNTEWLTGMANRRSFEAQLRREIDEFIPGDATQSVAVGILDLDRFKAVNDQLGHAVGDDVLVQIANIIHSQVRDIDTVARLGGDEFALLLRDSSVQEAKQVAKRVLGAIRSAMAGHDDVRRDLAASLGVTMLINADRVPGDVLRRADIACYQAKELGGNCARSTL